MYEIVCLAKDYCTSQAKLPLAGFSLLWLLMMLYHRDISALVNRNGS